MDLLANIQLALQWKKARDSVYKLYTLLNKETGDAEYKERMKELQEIIKAYAVSKKMDNTVAFIELAAEVGDARFAIQILAAGYELSLNNDYTITKTDTNETT
jgi:hypothetical protein